MRGVQLIGHGGLDRLRYTESIPVPGISPTDVLIRVKAAGINNTDLNLRVGWYSKSNASSADSGWTGEEIQFPLIQGADVCGEVVACGDQVDSELLNKRVLVEPCLREVDGQPLSRPWYLGSDCDGGFAEYVRVAARHAHPVNTPLSDVELASFPCSYSTAENLLSRVGLNSGETVLVTGASGGVGSAAIQLAKARGADVIALTSPSKMDKILNIGADRVLSRDADLLSQLGKDSVDVVVDLVAGSQWPGFLEILRPFGRYSTSGAIAGPIVELDVRTLYLKDLTLMGCTVLGEEVFANLVRRIELKQLIPLVEKTFSIRQIPEAQTEFERKQHIGKFVVDFSLNSVA